MNKGFHKGLEKAGLAMLRIKRNPAGSKTRGAKLMFQRDQHKPAASAFSRQKRGE
ncbi:MAG: hypothetical protein R8G34_02510 [Paracoccaceae bacterium]|nr:hypothetical protein [Paracoccaceae bacterium]